MADWDWSMLGGAAPASKFGGLYGGTASGLDPASFPVPPIPPDIDTSAPTPEGWGAGGYNSAPAAGASSDQLAKALGTLGKGAGAGQQAAAAAAKPGAQQLGQAPLGQPRSAVSLTPLLQLLAQRREALMNSATGGVGAGQANPQGGQRVTGLLGF